MSMQAGLPLNKVGVELVVVVRHGRLPTETSFNAIGNSASDGTAVVSMSNVYPGVYYAAVFVSKVRILQGFEIESCTSLCPSRT